jgi:hypothetical protein
MLPPAAGSSLSRTQVNLRAFHPEPRPVTLGFSNYLDLEQFDAVLSRMDARPPLTMGPSDIW